MNARRILTCTVLLAALTGCKERSGPIGQRRDIPPQRGGTMQMGTFVDIRNLDPAIAFDEAAHPITDLLFNRLVEYDRSSNIVPVLAEHFEVSSDGLRYSFKLREGVLFHDGAELTAADIKRSVERTLAPETPCPAPAFYASIAGFEAFHEGIKDAAGNRVFAPHLDGVVVDGRYALHIDLSQTDATFLPVMTLAFMAPLCQSAGSKYAREWGNRACGTGPFRLAEWQAAREITLVRHDGYFEPGVPYLDKVRWFLLMPSLTQRFKFEDGELDHVRELRLPDLIYYRTDPVWKRLGQWEAPKGTSGVFFNTQMAPFDNVEFRRAFVAAIDWSKIADAKPEQVVVATQMVPPAVPGYDPTFQGQRYDPAAALEHMKRAGYAFDPTTGKGGYPGVVRFVGAPTSIGIDLMAPMIREQVARIGIQMEIKQISWAGFLAETGKRNAVQLGYAGWNMDFPDPSDFFEPILATEAIQEEETQNAAFFSNPELDRLLKEAHSELDPVKRAAHYRRCEEIVRDDAPWAIGIGYRYFELVHPYVHNYVVDTTHTEDVSRVWLDQAQKKLAQRPGGVAHDGLAMIRPWGRR
jgi:ABC-type transport system substrate-binding protein